jgi:hypothetical protein
VLFLGTNDIRRRRHPERATTGRRFEADVRRVLVTLQEWAEHVFVAAIPPLGHNAKNHDPAAVATFSDRLARLCAEGDYIFFDPFAAIRAPGGCLATSGIFADGIHLADYSALTAEVDQFVGFVLDSKRRPSGGLPVGTLGAEGLYYGLSNHMVPLSVFKQASMPRVTKMSTRSTAFV